MAGNNRHARRAGQARDRRAGAPRLRPVDQAQALLAAGRLGEAFDAFRITAAATPPDRAARAAFGAFLIANVPARSHPDIDAVFAAALDEAWLRPEALAPAAIRYLEHGAGAVIGAVPDLAASGVQALLSHPVLLALLRATPAATPRLEIFLARARHAALRDGAAAVPLPFLIALAERAAASGFALTLPARDAEWQAEEARCLVDLRAAASAGDPAAVALLGCYEPLRNLPEPVWAAPALAALKAAHLVAPARAAAIAAGLAPITAIDASSAPVAAQYEADPYPMWVREPIGLAVAVPQAVTRRADPSRVRRVLVAGCGTGQHALVAADRWPRASLLAIDLSRASLAHAIAKTSSLGITRIRFALGDLLEVATIGERFPVIEAVGVLHHLADPAAGLKALAGALAPGGVMLVALYARRARAGLASARSIADHVPATAAAIRAWRARALDELAAPEILHSPDFYSIGGCRDLVFHVREQSYDLLEIGALAEAAGLAVIAVEPPPRALPNPPGAVDLAGWDACEQAEPMLFGGMYHVWLGSTRG
ncbi:MAG: hypothetical protein C0500_10255 [Sphingobium sp.]|nr:hypothetical protein [Sphingobium sp.]